MRIALINDFWPGTGIGNYAFSLFNELEKKIDIEMVYLDADKKFHKSQERIRKIKGISFPVLNHVLNNALVFPGKIPAGFDAYHASNQYLSHLVAGKSKSIVSCMDTISKRLGADYNPIVGFFWNSSMKQMKNAKKIIAISHFTKREITKQFGIPKEKIEVIHLGFDSSNFLPQNKKSARRGLGIEEGASVVLNVGSEEKRKNIPTLLRAFSKIAEKEPEALLVRVGEQRQETIRLIKELGIEKKVKYFNSLPVEKLSLTYNAADVFCYCSYYEGFGLPVLEAMACGTPVVAAAAASVPEIVEKAGVLVKNPLDAEAFAAETANLLENFGERKKLERKGFVQARKFGWKKNAEETRKVYESVFK